MIISYKECLKQFGSDYKIKNLLKENKIYKIQDGIYSTEQYVSDIEVITVKYPEAIYTMDSAFYFYGLTDVIPEVHYISTKRNATRIHDDNIKQSFVEDALFDLGKTEIEYQGDKILIYNQERMLIELIRHKNKLPLDYYKEIINNYRTKINELDFGKISEYAKHFKMKQTIMNTIQMEVL